MQQAMHYLCVLGVRRTSFGENQNLPYATVAKEQRSPVRSGSTRADEFRLDLFDGRQSCPAAQSQIDPIDQSTLQLLQCLSLGGAGRQQTAESRDAGHVA